MIDISKDIRSLSDFKRNTTDFVREMKESGKPVVLTVNGRSELVVQDATSELNSVSCMWRITSQRLSTFSCLSLSTAWKPSKESKGV